MNDRSFARYLPRVANALRLRGPLADIPTARILHSLLIGSSIWMVFNLAIVLPFVTPAKALSIPMDFWLLFTFFFAGILLRRGRMQQASILYVGGVWLIVTLTITLSGAIHSPMLLLYVGLPVSAAWLLGFRAALLLAAACLMSTLVMALLDAAHIRLPIYFPGKPFGVWSNVLYATVIATVPAAQVLKILREALAASQRDVTQRTRAEEELLRYQSQLEELVEQRTAELCAANQAKSAFLANMSHELRTPLNAILGFATLVRQDTGLPEKHRRDLEIVHQSGEHLLDLINDVLDVAKIEAGRLSMQQAPFDVRALVHETVEMIRPRAHAKSIELLVTMSSAVPNFILSDAGKLRRILLNLIDNAVKFTEEGSVILRIAAEPIDGNQRLLLILEVQDTGVGIAPEDEARIFLPFVRVGKTTRQSGTGLGLSIVRNFVQLMGGAIHLRSAPGKGSFFHVEVPVARAAQSSVLTTQGGDRQVTGLEPGQPEYRILIVEDKRENWQLLQRLLGDAGFQVQVAEDGAQAVKMFRTWQPHLICMDLRLPILGGIEATREIRTMDGGLQVKIVAVTASVFTYQREEVLASGLDDFVRKPYRPEEIFDCIARHLGVRYSYSEARRAPPAGSIPAVQLEALSALAPQLRKELANALVLLDPGAIEDVIDRVSKKDARLGEALARCSKQFAYTELLHALEECDRLLQEEAYDG